MSDKISEFLKIVNQKSGIPTRTETVSIQRLKIILQLLAFDVLIVFRKFHHRLQTGFQLVVIGFAFFIGFELSFSVSGLKFASDDGFSLVSNRLILFLVFSLKLIDLGEKCAFVLQEFKLEILQRFDTFLSPSWQVLHHALEQNAL